MTFTNFIKRPVLSTVVSIVLVLLGTIGLVSLPIEQYPDTVAAVDDLGGTRL